ncbi:hypothetical protein JCM10212_002947 [Sporobolomyces blumeae]
MLLCRSTTLVAALSFAILPAVSSLDTRSTSVLTPIIVANASRSVETDHPLSPSDDFVRFDPLDSALPPPLPADYEFLTPEDLSLIFPRFIVVGSSGTETTETRYDRQKRALGKGWTGVSKLTRAGMTGVGAMQVSVVDDDHILIYDKAEDNPLKLNGHSAWGSLYTISTRQLSNGTLVSVGGNPPQTGMQVKPGDGLAAIRLFTPCGSGSCDVQEWPSRIRITSPRWYASTSRLTDGSVIIIGGMRAGGYNNDVSTDNPTLEFYPPKGDGLQVCSPFLHDALKSNLFPVVFTLPNGLLFVAANQLAMLYDWKNNIEYRLANFPNGVTITYPSSAAVALLPLTVANDWTPEVIACGGTTVNLNMSPTQLSATVSASRQCSRMVLNAAGIKGGWRTESMPIPRVMGDFIMTPDGKLVLINGAQQGIAGYGNVKDEIGASNARAPALQPFLYDPDAPLGQRFSSQGLPASTIERLYHSSATLIPSGAIWIAGSNPNDKPTTQTYATRYEVEVLSPPYMRLPRPTYVKSFSRLWYGKSVNLAVTVPAGTKSVRAVIMDLGDSTHAVHNQRLVELKSTWSGGSTLTIIGPAHTGIYPPGYAWLFVLADDVLSKSRRIMVGPGTGPPVSAYAIDNMLKKTSGSPWHA